MYVEIDFNNKEIIFLSSAVWLSFNVDSFYINNSAIHFRLLSYVNLSNRSPRPI